MLMHHHIALDNFKKTIPLTDEDQKLVSFSTRPYVGRGKSYNYSDRREGYSRKSGGRGKEPDRNMLNVTITKPGQPKEGHTTMTVSVLQDSNKRQVEPHGDSSRTP